MRRAALVALALLALALLLGGCVYYNGMYNTERLARSARRAEREGRPFEANNLWGQVITRADSLVLRHPRSKYADQALVFKGLALARLGQCPEAVGPLARAPGLDLDREIAEEAALAFGRCQLELGDPGAAGGAFTRVVESADGTRSREARLGLARAHRLTGSGDAALVALDGIVHPRAAEERLLALAAADRREEALALADSMLAVNDSVLTWDSIIMVVGRGNPPIASALVDRVGGRPSVTPALHARRLLEDAERLERVDSARAEARLRDAAHAGANTESGQQAEVRLLVLEVRGATAAADLGRVADALERSAPSGPAAAREAQLLAATVASVRSAVDSAVPGTPQGDLRLFLAAETARDSLRAPALAAALFRQVVEGWPDSPYAPKAFLAGRMLDPVWGEQVQGLLDERYAASPYLAFVRGEDPAGYRELEDSLQSYALTRAAGQARRRAPAAGVRRRDAPRAPGDSVRRQRPDTPRGLEP
jgi:tetratricopeptide (TPR) repeat protein